MMFEAIEIIDKLFSGKVVKHDGRALHGRERASSIPGPSSRSRSTSRRPGPINAKKTGRFADGMITVGAADEKIAMLWDKFAEGALEAARTRSACPSCSRSTSRGRRPTRRPSTTPSGSGRTAGWPSPSRTSGTPRTSPRWRSWCGPEHFTNRVLMTSDLDAHTAHIQHYVDMGFDEVHLHNVGRNQAEFIEVFGKEVLPHLNLD